MYPPARYLAWAIEHYGRAPFDLATSGIPSIALADLGEPGGLEARSLDDPSAPGRLRAAIARYLDRPESEVTPALGTSHALWLAYASLAAPGDEILVEDPAYEPLLAAAQGVGAKLTRFVRRADDGYAIDPSHVASQMTDRTRLVVLSTLHNPTGVCAPDDVITELARVVAKRGAYLLVDEVYAPFDALGDAAGRWAQSARRLGERVIAVGSLTKCYGLGPHRVGWLVGPREVTDAARATLLASTSLLPLSHAAIGAFAFDHLPTLAARARSLVDGGRAIVEAHVAARPAWRWSAPTSGLFGLVRLPGEKHLLARIERGIAEHGVIVAPGSFFGVDDGFRLSWAIDRAKLSEALARLDRVLAAPPP